MKKGFPEFFLKFTPDILCLQEIKGAEADMDLSWLPQSYRAFWNSAEKKGYSGTACFSRLPVLGHARGLSAKGPDEEGRVLTLEFNSFFLVNVYTPNAQRELTRLEFRQQWDSSFLRYVRSLEKKKPVLFCGDLNVAHEEIDLANPKSNRGNAGFTDEERAGFGAYLKAGFVDTFRALNKDAGHYTWWTYRSQARERNIGWRIDYFCASQTMFPRVTRAEILKDVMGSDHCPVLVEVDA